MSRTTTTTNAELRKTAVAPRITIDWNPHDDTGVVEFRTAIMEYVNGEFQRMLPSDPIVASMGDVLMREVTVELPNGTTVVVPPGLIGLWVKQVFDDIYTEHVESAEQLALNTGSSLHGDEVSPE